MLSTAGATPTPIVSVADELLPLASVLTAVTSSPFSIAGLMSVAIQLPVESTVTSIGSPLTPSTNGSPVSGLNSVIVVPGSPVPVSTLPSAVLLMFGVIGGMLSTGGVVFSSPTEMVSDVDELLPASSVLIAVTTSPSTRSGAIPVAVQLPAGSTMTLIGSPPASTRGAPFSANNSMVVPGSPVPVNSLPSSVLLMFGATGGMLSTGGVLLASPTEMVLVADELLPAVSVLTAMTSSPSSISGLIPETDQPPVASTRTLIG